MFFFCVLCQVGTSWRDSSSVWTGPGSPWRKSTTWWTRTTSSWRWCSGGEATWGRRLSSVSLPLSLLLWSVFSHTAGLALWMPVSLNLDHHNSWYRCSRTPDMVDMVCIFKTLSRDILINCCTYNAETSPVSVSCAVFREFTNVGMLTCNKNGDHGKHCTCQTSCKSSALAFSSSAC